ncbi:Nuclear factor NF-kappa-B p105 subunit, partial [Phlyctochytrium bullatum]
MVEALIKLRADVNAADLDGATPLNLAIRRGKAELVDRLLLANADINVMDAAKHSALYYACKHSEHEMARVLLEKRKAAAAAAAAASPKPMPRKPRTAMSRSPSSNGFPSAGGMYGAPPQVDILNAADRFGYTPLLLTCELGDPVMLDILLQYGADTTKCTKAGKTALHLAVQAGNVDVVTKILQLPVADVQASDARGLTPLHIAASHHRLDLLQLLESHSSRSALAFSLVDDRGRTPLHAACVHERPHYTPFVVGIRTPPTAAKDEQILEVVRKMVEWGSPTDVADMNGETPVDVARSHGLESIVAFLLVHNANQRNTEEKNGEAGAADGDAKAVTVVSPTTGATSGSTKPPLVPLQWSDGTRKVSLTNLRVPVELRLGALHGNVSLEGVAAVLEEGAWRFKNNFDRANPFSVVVVVGPRAASSGALKEINPSVGVEPLKQETLLK